MTPVIVTAILVVVIGSIIAVGWWAVADKVFPSSRSRRGEGEQHRGPKPKVVRGFDSTTPTESEDASHPKE